MRISAQYLAVSLLYSPIIGYEVKEEIDDVYFGYDIGGYSS